MDYNILLEGFVTLLTGGLSAWGGWFFARKKYDAEVDNQKIENIDHAVKVYQDILDDVNARLNETLTKNRKMEEEMAELRKQVFDLTMNICLDLSCMHRVREVNKTKKTTVQNNK